MQAVPLAVALLSMLFLAERSGWRPHDGDRRRLHRCADDRQATPSPTSTIYELLALVIVFCRGGPRHCSRSRIPARIPTFLVALGNAGFVTAGGAALCAVAGLCNGRTPGRWACWPSPPASSPRGYLFMVATLRLGELSGTAPFRYSIMVFAIVSGILVFGEFPDWIAMLGMAADRRSPASMPRTARR